MASWSTIRVQKFAVGDADPVGTQAAVASPTGGTTTDAEARAAIDALIARLIAAGVIAEEA